ncbi:malonyl-CoA decarboxylase [Marinobacterium jannaschii]|uniref:malonyl-CoA decarboxylase n=1 Tax=Marinobacterium jannaschii TaxID=64970 RepID=UPI000A41D0F2|nr:malonyl-CoA decarboxylase [Marinobacterium jannaschii]
MINRTWSRLRELWNGVAVFGQSNDENRFSPELPDAELPRLRQWMDACLDARGGEVSARALAAALGYAYMDLNEAGRLRFLRLLATEYGRDNRVIEAHILDWQQAGDEEARQDAAQKLHHVLEPPRSRLLTLFNELPEGVKFLVDMRAELLDWRRDHPELKPLEQDLKRLLISWFDIGFLKLEQISWRSPAALLEKLIAYEAVHAIQSWDDLKNRLDSDRRCFAFFHPHMPDEPLIFVEVALVNGLANSIQNLLDECAPLQDLQQADTAIFYSISNAQRGLAGISFGNFLIKRVVALLEREFHHLQRFATLSPIPGLRRWLDKGLANPESMLLPAEEKLLRDAGLNLADLLLKNRWQEDPELVALLEPLICRLTARYLVKEKRHDGKAVDPVANFHLSNGARVEQINWLADRSVKGIRQSAGMMVNYLYQLDEIEQNSQQYTESGGAAHSAEVGRLLN